MEKTAMQELIEQMYTIYNWEHTTFQERAGIASCIGKAKKLLEKDKQHIIDAYDAGYGSSVLDRKYEAKQYYKDKFKK